MQIDFHLVFLALRCPVWAGLMNRIPVGAIRITSRSAMPAPPPEKIPPRPGVTCRHLRIHRQNLGNRVWLMRGHPGRSWEWLDRNVESVSPHETAKTRFFVLPAAHAGRKMPTGGNRELFTNPRGNW